MQIEPLKGVSRIKSFEIILEINSSLNIVDYFDYIAEASLIINTKPDPEVFNVCCEALGLKQRDCVGFEDAQAGIEAIHAANMFSVGINVMYKPNRHSLF